VFRWHLASTFLSSFILHEIVKYVINLKKRLIYKLGKEITENVECFRLSEKYIKFLLCYIWK
jgi:hypothetical protein